MKIGILGSRGIPNHYGGFEEFAAHLAPGLAAAGMEVCVYCSSSHPYKNKIWNGVHLIHCYDPEEKIGTPGQFIYDLNCIIDSRRRNFDVIYQLGYTSNSLWHLLLPKKSIIVTNMDGLEWQRSKYNRFVQRFLKYAERLAVESSGFLIADARAIAGYLKNAYNREAKFIPYGASIADQLDAALLEKFGFTPFEYHLVIARLQPDNHVEEIIKGVLKANDSRPLVVVGSFDNKFGRYLKTKYAGEKILFAGSLFDKSLLQSLVYYSRIYFHGHSAGGTNPSLLEAMAASAFIVAHNNPFNREVLGGNAFYFSTPEDIAAHLNAFQVKDFKHPFIINNLASISNRYNWPQIIKEYVEFFNRIITKQNTDT
jgi:glycosyltransferase involved in cell wall biosynthesis